MKIFDFLFPFKLKSSAHTDKGKKRPHNEDSILSDDINKLYVVADGIGGHGSGEIASRQCLNILKEYIEESSHLPSSKSDSFQDQLSQVNFENANDIGTTNFPSINLLINAIFLANSTIYSKNKKEKEKEKGEINKRGMGTTLAGCWFLPKQKKIILFNIGDSRVYLLREHNLIQRTHDHSLLQHWIDNGKQGDKPSANIILRAIGPSAEVQAEIELANIQRGDTWLICSDGLHGMLSNQQIKDFLINRTSDKSLSNYPNFSSRLIDKANYAGGIDNISVIIIHIT